MHYKNLKNNFIFQNEDVLAIEQLVDVVQEGVCNGIKGDGSVDDSLIGDRSITDNLMTDNTISDSFLERAITTHLSSGDEEEIFEDGENNKNVPNHNVRLVISTKKSWFEY
jgi:hypothetical protein